MPTLSNAPDDTKVIVTSFLDVKSLLIFSTVSRNARYVAEEELETRVRIPALQAIVHGNQDDVEKTLKNIPGLLLHNIGAVHDYSGKKVSGSLLKAAICAGDTDMLDMMWPYLEKAAGSKAKAHAIFKSVMDEIFPKGLNEHLKLQKRNAFNFKPILDAILGATEDELKFALDNPGQDNGSTLCQALNNFRESFTKTALEELVFNPEHFLAALQTYIDNFAEIASNDPNWRKRDLFCRQVIGFTQRYFSACYMQAISQGVYHIVENKEPLARRFSFRNEETTSLIPLTSCSGPGFNYFAAAARAGEGCVAAVGLRTVPLFVGLMFGDYCWKNYVKQKHQTCRNLYSLCSSPSLNQSNNLQSGRSPAKQTCVVA